MTETQKFGPPAEMVLSFSFNMRLPYHLAETLLRYRQVLILAPLFGLIAHHTYKFGELIKPVVRERHHNGKIRVRNSDV
jgi:hypothetical protein